MYIHCGLTTARFLDSFPVIFQHKPEGYDGLEVAVADKAVEYVLGATLTILAVEHGLFLVIFCAHTIVSQKGKNLHRVGFLFKFI